MSKFANRPTQKPSGPIETKAKGTKTVTHEGGEAWVRKAKSELFLLAATNMVSEDTFYEAGAARDERFLKLVHGVATSSPEWIQGFIGYLRNTLQMRSASLVMACEYIRSGAPGGRQVLNEALQRADEPAEAVGYWLSQYGRKMPAPFKRGVADAVVRLYTERNALKWDGQAKTIRFADVIELVHPRPRESWQSELFHYLLDKRHHPDNAIIGERLELIHLDRRLQAMPEKGRRVALREGLTQEAGWSWERLSGWLPGGMDAEAWESLIPHMGYMALIRNLRNFEENGISKDMARKVRDRIEDPEEVIKSRQFPYRFWSAYKHVPSLTWGGALEDALDLSCRNIPELRGRTLILIDTSASMNSAVSGKSQAMRYEIAALFAGAVAKRAARADVVIFGDHSKAFPIGKTESVLRYVQRVSGALGSVGHGTMIWSAVRDHFAGHDRVVIFTDEQTMDSAGNPARMYYGRNEALTGIDKIPVIHGFNLAGYGPAMMPSKPGRYSYGGFTDATFVLMAALESGEEAGWPWE